MPSGLFRILAHALLWLSLTWAGIGAIAFALSTVFPPVAIHIPGRTVSLIFGAPAAAGLLLAGVAWWIARTLRARHAARRAQRAADAPRST